MDPTTSNDIIRFRSRQGNFALVSGKVDCAFGRTKACLKIGFYYSPHLETSTFSKAHAAFEHLHALRRANLRVFYRHFL
jgi:hypothetical protein